MEKLFYLLLFIVTLPSFGQDIEAELKKVKTMEQATTYVSNNTKLKAEILTFSSELDTSEPANSLYGKKKGDIIELDNYYYKIIETKKAYTFRVSYIYFDANKITLSSINDRRTNILNRYKSGTPFIDLVKEYTMDTNPTGNLEFKEDGLEKEFEKAVKAHRKDDIFWVDLPNERWYYVVLKTFEDRTDIIQKVLKVKNGNVKYYAR
jgi:hypothetical protein